MLKLAMVDLMPSSCLLLRIVHARFIIQFDAITNVLLLAKLMLSHKS